ncbi:hypothetical protein J6590_049985 [Homalodisca vitripennis]|nr:hypothetical protein J6590_049985 [Homalodisca vitripennis]
MKELEVEVAAARICRDVIALLAAVAGTSRTKSRAVCYCGPHRLLYTSAPELEVEVTAARICRDVIALLAAVAVTSRTKSRAVCYCGPHRLLYTSAPELEVEVTAARDSPVSSSSRHVTDQEAGSAVACTSRTKSRAVCYCGPHRLLYTSAPELEVEVAAARICRDVIALLAAVAGTSRPTAGLSATVGLIGYCIRQLQSWR